MDNQRHHLTIPIKPWFYDHAFQGRAVFPAVESMLVMAEVVRQQRPDLPLNQLGQARFGKFLVVPAEVASFAVEVDLVSAGQGLTVTLYSRKQLKAMSRLQEHGVLHFQSSCSEGEAIIPGQPAPTEYRLVDCQRLYQELVPFGPAYRSLVGELMLSEQGAWGTLQTPDLPASWPVAEQLGSPFPLDGAMHAACAWGQQYVDFVPFPVGFGHRQVVRPTEPGGHYLTQAIAIAQDEQELLFDLLIYNEHGDIFEQVNGLRMRDVTGGAIKPPAWIKA